MNKQEYLSELAKMVVSNDWDLPTPGREIEQRSKYHGPDEEVQEKIKEKGRELQGSSLFENKLIGYGLEAYSHYYRSLESAIIQGRKHPNVFAEYFPHWLYSNPNYLTKDTFKVFSYWFLKPKSIKIKEGKTYWKSRS